MKLKPIPDKLALFCGGYRGDLDIEWDLVTGKGRDIEVFATFCPHCGQAWGWTPLISQVRKIRRAMEVHGCPRCGQKSTHSSGAIKRGHKTIKPRKH